MTDDPIAGQEEVPLVCFDADICRIFKISHTTLKRLRKHGAFPIAELPSFDKSHRYGRPAVLACLQRTAIRLQRPGGRRHPRARLQAPQRRAG